MPLYFLFLFAMGLGCAVWLPSLPILYCLFFVACACLSLVAYFLRPLFCICLGLAIGYIQIGLIIDRQLPEPLELVTLDAVVQITSMPELNRDSVKFKAKPLKLSCVKAPARWKGDPVKLRQSCESLKNFNNTIALSQYFYTQDTQKNAPVFSVGDIWSMQIKLRRPRGLVNESGFDYQAWLLSNNVFATGYIVSKYPIKRLSTLCSWCLDYFFERKRESFSKWLDSTSASSQSHSLVRALLIGDKSRISSSQWQTLNTTGTVHLMAISGLHIGLAALIGFWLLKFITCRFVGVGLTYNVIRLFPYLASCLCAFLYAGLAGFSVPTLRALVMVLVFNMMVMVGKDISPLRVLVLSAVAVILIEPFAFMATGFWLSFLAVALLLFFLQRSDETIINEDPAHKDTSKRITKTVKACFSYVRNYVKSLILMQWLLFIGMFIPVLILTQSISLVSPLANIVFVTLVSLLIVPCIFIGAFFSVIVPELSFIFIKMSYWLLDNVWPWLLWLEHAQQYINHNLSQFAIYQSWLTISVGIICSLCFLISRRFNLHFIALSMLLAACIGVLPRQKYFQLHVVDVGQGLSVVIEHKDVTVVYDTGAFFSESFDIGKNVLSPLIKNNKVKILDALFISHSDNDHIGGAKSLLAIHKVKEVVISAKDEKKSLERLGDSTGQISHCERGQSWVYGLVQITALWPDNNESADTLYAKPNNRSCVLLVSYNNTTILLSGDISRTVEKKLVEYGLPEIDILVAAHHGSGSSSSELFIKAIKPAYVVFSAGYKNRYAHPSKKIVDRFVRHGSAISNTAIHGGVTFVIDEDQAHKKAITVIRHRDETYKRWID